MMSQLFGFWAGFATAAFWAGGIAIIARHERQRKRRCEEASIDAELRRLEKRDRQAAPLKLAAVGQNVTIAVRHLVAVDLLVADEIVRLHFSAYNRRAIGETIQRLGIDQLPLSEGNFDPHPGQPAVLFPSGHIEQGGKKP